MTQYVVKVYPGRNCYAQPSIPMEGPQALAIVVSIAHEFRDLGFEVISRPGGGYSIHNGDATTLELTLAPMEEVQDAGS